MQKGFTLIELLLYVAISAAILLATTLFLSLLLQSRIKNQTVSEVDSQGVHVMQHITQAVRNADDVTAPTLGNTGALLSLVTVSVATNPTIFDLASGAIQIKESSGAVVPLTNNRVVVSNVQFSNLSRVDTPGTVRVQFTITSVNNSGRNEYSYSKTFASTATLRQP